jgi:hypothetical protein
MLQNKLLPANYADVAEETLPRLPARSGGDLHGLKNSIFVIL